MNIGKPGISPNSGPSEMLPPIIQGILFVLFGDWQICFQTYADLYQLNPEERKIARAREVMEYQMSSNRNDYWWWADGLYMVMPVMTRLHKINIIAMPNIYIPNTALQKGKRISGLAVMVGC